MNPVVIIQDNVQRILDSYAESNRLLEIRESQGIQPYFAFSGTQNLMKANFLYFCVTAALYIWMQGRKTGFNIKPLIAVYNFICVLLAGYVVYGIAWVKLSSSSGKFVCMEGATQDSECLYLAHIFWVFYIQKFWEFLDTWFFILRRSFRQVTFLHLFHHTSITLVVGLILPHNYCGDMFLPIFCNAFVHVLMYSHYLVTALGIRSWWRQYLTSLQLIQFVLISVQSGMAYSRGALCGTPDWAKALLVIYMGSMLFLFGNFFVRRYVIKSKGDLPPACLGVVKGVEVQEEKATFTGVTMVNKAGVAEVVLSREFKDMVNHLDDEFIFQFHYQLTPIGSAMPGLFVEKEIDMDASRYTFAVGGGKAGFKVSWSVNVVATLMTKQKRS